MRDGANGKKYDCGNYETLRKDEILDIVKDFFHEKYSKNIRNLVICGPESIETLKEFAVDFTRVLDKDGEIVIPNEGNCFIKVDNSENDAKFSRTLGGVLSHEEYELFDEKYFSKFFSVCPLG